MSRHPSKEKAHKKHKSQRSRHFITQLFIAFLVNLIFVVRGLVERLVNYVLEIYLTSVYDGKTRVCPDLKKDFFITKSASEIAELIRNGEISCEQVCNSYINRLIEINPFCNAVLDGPFLEALDEAKQLDSRIRSGMISRQEFSEKPFLGVPFTTKDSTAVKNKLHTLGIVARKNRRSNEDAECVKLVKEAGGIIIATSSIPEINRWQETRNNIIGQTCNPYDIRRTVGGSSGGEGALISSCATTFGLGTDIGGSIRMPAFYCGIFGHKPTPGLVNTRGCTFRTGTEKNTMVVAGPMARFSSDLTAIFKVLVGPKLTSSLKLNDKVDVKKLRYFYCLDNGDLKCSLLSSEVKSSIEKVVDYFYDITGREVQFLKPKGVDSSAKLWRYHMTKEPGNFNYMLGNSQELNPLIELFKKLVGRSDLTLASIFSLMDSILPSENASKMEKITEELDTELSNLLRDDGVLIYPSAPELAPFHYAAFVQVYNFHYWSIFNVLKMPATQVPLGLDSKKLPLGVQIVAGKNQDRLCLAVAEELERKFGGWVPPFSIKSTLHSE